MRVRLASLAVGAALAAGLAEPGPARAQSLNPFAGVPGEDLSAFTGRPLFSESRRPVHAPVAPPPAQPAPPASPSPDGLRLIGTVVSSSGGLARVQDGAAQAITVRPGDRIAGWTVAEIGAESIHLQAGEHEALLSLFVAPPTARPAAAAVPPVAGRSPAGGTTAAGTTPAQANAAQGAGNDAPPGTVAGTAAAEAARNAPFQLTFGGTPRE